MVLIGQSPHAHAAITAMDLSAVAAAEGVVAVLTHADIPGVNDCSPVYGDDPILADGEVSYVGQAVFAIVARTMRAARDALPLAKVRYEERPAILTIDEAMKAGSWLGPSATMESGTPDTALAGAAHIVGRIRSAARNISIWKARRHWPFRKTATSPSIVPPSIHRKSSTRWRTASAFRTMR